MKVCILANDLQRKELLGKPFSKDTQMKFVEDLHQLRIENSCDLYLLLKNELNYNDFFNIITNKHVLINSVSITLRDMNAPYNFHRINGWNGFLGRKVWEIASADQLSLKYILDEIGCDWIGVKDKPGLVSARIIAMIINEAYFALEEKVSCVKDIDIAMKLGTNYPFGPFEWAKIIGIKNILKLLQKLFLTDPSYEPSKALIAETL